MFDYDKIDYQACGYCQNEEICIIRNEYMKYGKRKDGGTAELAKECGNYVMDSHANPNNWWYRPNE